MAGSFEPRLTCRRVRTDSGRKEAGADCAGAIHGGRGHNPKCGRMTSWTEPAAPAWLGLVVGVALVVAAAAALSAGHLSRVTQLDHELDVLGHFFPPSRVPHSCPPGLSQHNAD